MKILNKIKIALFVLLSLSVMFFALGCEKQLDPETIYDTPSVDLDDYEYQPTFNTYGEVVLDGKLDDSVWQNQSKLTEKVMAGGIEHDIEISTYFAEEGLVAYYKLIGSPVYFNPYRDSGNNSGLELYFANDTITHIEQGSWEVSLDSGLVYTSKKYFRTASIGYGYQNFYAYIDRAIEIDGELNSPDSNGFVMEIMFPWEFLTPDGKMAKTMSMDAAIIYCADSIGSRNAWVSTAKTCLPSYSWENPRGWYRFSQNGYVTDDAEPIYTVNGGTGVENGSIVVDGTFGDGFVVKAMPNAGYDIDVFKINGVSYQFPLVEFSPRQDYVVDIEISFKPVPAGDLRNISISAGYSGGVYVPFEDGKAIALVNGDNNYTGVITDGVAKIYIPSGDYVLKTQDYSDITLTISDNVTDYDVKINKKLFKFYKEHIDVYDQGINGATIGFDEIGLGLSFGDSDMGTFNIDFNQAVVLDFSIKIQVATPIFTSFRFKDTTGTYIPQFYNIGSWTGNQSMLVKIGETTITTYDSHTATQVTENGTNFVIVDFYYVIQNGNVTLYQKTANKLVYLADFTADKQIGSMVILVTDQLGEVYYQNFKVITGDNIDKYSPATVQVSQSGETNVTVEKQVLGLGASTVITATPKPADMGENLITKVTVNGQEVETYMEGGSRKFVVTHTDLTATTYDVKVYTTNVNYKNIDVNFTGKTFNGGTSTPAKKVATFTGLVNQTATINDQGVASLQLVQGEYVVTVPGYLPAKVVIEESTTTVNVVIAEDISRGLENDFKIAYSEQDGYNFTSSTYWSRVYFNDKVPISDNIKISFTYNSTISSYVKHWVEFDFVSTTGQVITAQILTWGNNFYYKNPQHTSEQIHMGNYNQKVSFNFYIIFKDGVASLYNEDNSCVGSIMLAKDKDAPFGKLSEFYVHYAFDASYEWSITNFKVENLPN